MSDISDRIENDMPGIELLDYVRDNHITADTRERIIHEVHNTLEIFAKKRPGHSNFRYTRAGYLDKSGYDYILVVDGEWTWRTWLRKKKIRLTIKHVVAQMMAIEEKRIAVRYRIYNSSFG